MEVAGGSWAEGREAESAFVANVSMAEGHFPSSSSLCFYRLRKGKRDLLPPLGRRRCHHTVAVLVRSFRLILELKYSGVSIQHGSIRQVAQIYV